MRRQGSSIRLDHRGLAIRSNFNSEYVSQGTLSYRNFVIEYHIKWWIMPLVSKRLSLGSKLFGNKCTYMGQCKTAEWYRVESQLKRLESFITRTEFNTWDFWANYFRRCQKHPVGQLVKCIKAPHGTQYGLWLWNLVAVQRAWYIRLDNSYSGHVHIIFFYYLWR